MKAEQFKRISELLTELRCLNAVFITSLSPKARREQQSKVDEIGELREACEREAMNERE